ncbi:hypothetical protein NC652_000471 [Populus alba x Populus x berolinensis]|nr:hypothetical protein NC652_000471 [Populus alba x Populus x berolinensis]
MEAVIGGGMLNGAVDLLIQQLASPEVRTFFKCHKLDDGLLVKLTGTLNAVSELLDDAEEKQLIKPDVKNWLDEVKDAVYETEDLLDEIGYEAQRSKFEGESQTSMDHVRTFVSMSDESKFHIDLDENTVMIEQNGVMVPPQEQEFTRLEGELLLDDYSPDSEMEELHVIGHHYNEI